MIKYSYIKHSYISNSKLTLLCHQAILIVESQHQVLRTLCRRSECGRMQSPCQTLRLSLCDPGLADASLLRLNKGRMYFRYTPGRDRACIRSDSTRKMSWLQRRGTNFSPANVGDDVEAWEACEGRWGGRTRLNPGEKLVVALENCCRWDVKVTETARSALDWTGKTKKYNCRRKIVTP